MSHTAITDYLKRYHTEKSAISDFRTNRADVLAAIQQQSLQLQAALIHDLEKDRLANALTPSQKSGLLQSLNVLSGTAFDKERLETGKSTENISVMSQMLDSQVSSIYKRSQAIEKTGTPAPKEGAGSSESKESVREKQ